VTLLSPRPFVGRFLAHLHQPPPPRAAMFPWMKPAFAPNDRLHQHRIEMMFYRDGTNQMIVLVKPSRTHPFVKCINRIARARRQINKARREGKQYAKNQFKQKSNHSVRVSLLRGAAKSRPPNRARSRNRFIDNDQSMQPSRDQLAKAFGVN